MKTFKGEPIESKLNNPQWSRSVHKKWVMVRAEDEDRAITIVRRDFGIATKKQLGVEVLRPPWGNRDLVNWTEIKDAKYPSEGEEGVIEKG